MLKFTEDHEWVQVESDIVTVGITDYAAHRLGELVFVELPELGKDVSKGDAIVVVESCKAASDVYAPLNGTIIAVNDAVVETPKLVNDEPVAGGWLVKIKISDPSQLDALLDETAYSALVE